jgi:ABC-type transport system involved in multi-copper enzyme maturation permease subunit
MHASRVRFSPRATIRMLNAWFTLVWLSFRRLLWSTTTLMISFPLLGVGLFIIGWRWRGVLPTATEAELARSLMRFTDVAVMAMFLTFLLPICVLAYATSSLGGEREERTLVFLLTRPVPRWLILLAKLCSVLPLVLGITTGSFWVYCQLAGPVGQLAWDRYLPAVFHMTLAYVGLFSLFGVAFRHSTIVALIYALFIEPLVSSLPGIINHVSIRFYGWSFIERASGRAPSAVTTFYEPVTQAAAAMSLAIIAAGTFLAAGLLFQQREYRDIT